MRAVDDACQITDEEALPYIFDLVVEEGLVLGGSSAINIAGAVRVARMLGPGHTIVTILADYGTRYQSKLFNPDVPAREGSAGPGLARLTPAPHRESPMPDALVSTDWLESIWMPRRAGGRRHLVPAGPERNARAEHEAAHIPGAVFFDLDEVCEPKGLHPHMVPSAAKFSSRVRKLGLGDGARIVVYDDNRFFASARVWWMFRFMGHDDVMVLDGGLAKWRAEGRPVTDMPTRPRERHFTVRPEQPDPPRARPDARQPDQQARAGGRRALGRALPRPRAGAAPGLRAGTSPGPGTCTMRRAGRRATAP